MARPLDRACLEAGLKLDLNWIVRNGFVLPGGRSGELQICGNSDNAEPVSALLTTEVAGIEGSLRIKIGSIQQRIQLIAQHRHFGGWQWYFMCPVSQRRSSILWMPAGASRFASAHAWKGQAAYASQFQSKRDRAISAARGIRMRLGGQEWIALDSHDPMKPKGMRWSTYRRLLGESHRQMSLAYGWLANKNVGLPSR